MSAILTDMPWIERQESTMAYQNLWRFCGYFSLFSNRLGSQLPYPFGGSEELNSEKNHLLHDVQVHPSLENPNKSSYSISNSLFLHLEGYPRCCRACKSKPRLRHIRRFIKLWEFAQHKGFQSSIRQICEMGRHLFYSDITSWNSVRARMGFWLGLHKTLNIRC